MLFQEMDYPDTASAPVRREAKPRAGLYILVVLAAMVGAFAFHMRGAGIFACPATAYGDNRYLAYCQGSAYGDYDHGAVWFGLEPGVREAAAAADVLFLGNSRLQFGFSAPALGAWFEDAGARYYLLGFSHNETAKFTEPLLADLQPQARAYVINVDKFFFERESPPAGEVMHAPDAATRYAAKRKWQAPHRLLCGALPLLCGNEISFYRQRDTGAWRYDGSNGIVAQTVKDDSPDYTGGDPRLIAEVSANARSFEAFLDGLGVPRDCVVLTYVPSTENNRRLANAIAAAVGLDLIAPDGKGLHTIDGSHLDRESAQVFTTDFLALAGPRLAQCLSGPGRTGRRGEAMNWLPPPQDFRGRLAAAEGRAEGRLGALAALANTRLSFLETLQLDAALARAPAGSRPAEPGLEPVRLALLASGTVDHLLPGIRVGGLRRGLRIAAHAGGYGQYRQELLDPGGLAAFGPDAVLLALAARDFLGAVPLAAPAEAADAAVAAALADLRALWARARGLGALVVQQTFLDLEPPLFGGLDAAVPGAPARLVRRLNAALADAAAAEGVLLLDLAGAAARDGLDAWHDPGRWLQAKMEIAPQAGPMYGELVARLLGAARGKSRKCLVLDLDNTLWGGVIGDDGLAGIVIGQGSGVGEAHLALQAYAKRLNERGIVLAVCSKNDPAHRRGGLRPPRDAAQARRLRRLRRQLDRQGDEPARDRQGAEPRPRRPRLRRRQPRRARAGARRAAASRGARAAGRPRALRAHPRRGRLLRGDGLHRRRPGPRRAVRGQPRAREPRGRGRGGASGDMDAFLGALAMTVEAGPVTALNLARVTQLVNKTNQFNTTTMRRTEAEVAALAADPDGLTLQFRLLDKFGDNGIVSVMLLEPAEAGVRGGARARQLGDELPGLRPPARGGGAEHPRRGRPRPRRHRDPRRLRADREERGDRRPLPAPRLRAGAGEGRWMLSLAAHAARATRIRRKEAA